MRDGLSDQQWLFLPVPGHELLSSESTQKRLWFIDGQHRYPLLMGLGGLVKNLIFTLFFLGSLSFKGFLYFHDEHLPTLCCRIDLDIE